MSRSTEEQDSASFRDVPVLTRFGSSRPRRIPAGFSSPPPSLQILVDRSIERPKSPSPGH